MAYINVDKDVIGRTVSVPIYSDRGELLLTKGTLITEMILDKLSSHNIMSVNVFDELVEGIEIHPLISKEELIEKSNTIKNVFTDVLSNKKLNAKLPLKDSDFEFISMIVDNIMNDLESMEDILYRSVELLDKDEYTYVHSVEVALLSIITAKNLGYSSVEIKNIGLGALLHDIGKLMIPNSVLNKREKLTNEERLEIEKHPQYGFDLVKNCEKLPYVSKQIVLLHHEKLDGSGYPYGLVGVEIPEYVKIVTVCDIYDAITHNRVYRDKVHIHKALDMIIAESVYALDIKIFNALLKSIVVYPEGTGVVLSNNLIGVVYRYRQYSPVRPVVKIIKSWNNQKLNFAILDLEKNRHLHIKAVWDVSKTKNRALKNGFI